jgi:hypothetical protein
MSDFVKSEGRLTPALEAKALHLLVCKGVLSVPETRRLISVSSTEAVMLRKCHGELAAAETVRYRKKILLFFDLMMTASGHRGSSRKHLGARR